MKKFLFAFALFFSIHAVAQQYGSLYVAAKSGLTFRDGPGSNFKAIGNIPYGTKITIIQSDEVLKPHTVENITGYWQKVIYNNKTGYILDSYLLPWAPPKISTAKEMKQYLNQVTTPFGAQLKIRSGTANEIHEAGWEIRKQLYKNGAEWHQHFGYEYGSDVYFLPGFSIQQGFILLRLIPEFKNAIGDNDAFPSDNKTIDRGEHQQYKITVDKETYGDGYAWYKKINIQFDDDVSYELELFMLDNQLVISFSSGV